MTNASTPPSARIAAELRRRIASGELRPGARMPSTRGLVQRYGVAMATATKALATLRQEGLIRSVPGVGTVVASEAVTPVSERPRRRRTPPNAPLGLDLIVAAGITVADAEGLSGLSMRRVAAELGAAPMSLYRHVSDKDDLLLKMIDAVIVEVALPDQAPSSCRRGLELAARALWTTFRRHPWLATALSLTRPQMLPGALAYGDWVLGLLTATGMEPLTAFMTHLTVFTFVRGTAMNLELEADAEAAGGQTADEWVAAQEPVLEALIAGGRYPNFGRVLRGMDFDLDLDALFEFGLQRLLDGVAAMSAAPNQEAGRDRSPAPGR